MQGKDPETVEPDEGQSLKSGSEEGSEVAFPVLTVLLRARDRLQLLGALLHCVSRYAGEALVSNVPWFQCSLAPTMVSVPGSIPKLGRLRWNPIQTLLRCPPFA